MKVSNCDLDNVIRCIEEQIHNTNVYIDFCKADYSSSGRKEHVDVTIRDEENDSTMFCTTYDDIFQAYPILLGIYYGICMAKGEPFDYSPLPAGADWE